MPYQAFPTGDQFCVHKLNADGSKGQQVKCHATQDAAMAQMKALMAQEPMMAKVAKVNTDEQLVFGWAYVSADPNGDLIVDSQGDAIEPAELEKAAYDHVLNFGETGVRHEGETVGKLVESFMLTPEKAQAMGLPDTQAAGWWVGYHVADSEVFAKVKDGTYSMWSIQGKAMETA